MTTAKEASPQEILHMIKNLRRPEYLGETSFSWLIARIEQLESALYQYSGIPGRDCDRSTTKWSTADIVLHTGPKPGAQE